MDEITQVIKDLIEKLNVLQSQVVMQGERHGMLEGQVESRVAQLNEQVGNVQNVLSMLESGRVGRTSEPKCPSPDKFSGSRGEIENFLSTVRRIFLLQPSRFTTEVIKINYVATLLTGDALRWFRALEEDPKGFQEVRTVEDLFKLMKGMFGDPNESWNAQRQLNRLKQAGNSCTHYVMKFRSLAVKSGYDDQSLKKLFYDGLNEDIKDALAMCIQVPEDLNEYLKLCINIDGRLFERRMERKGDNKGRKIETAKGARITSFGDGESMNLSNVRQSNTGIVCFKCHKRGHFKKDCPDQPKQVAAVKKIRKLNSNDASIVIPIKLIQDSRVLNTTALVDSGAALNFVRRSLVERGSFLLKPCGSFSVHLADNSDSKITEEMNVAIDSDGVTCETQLYVMDSMTYPVILGIPWLSSVNPRIDWKHRTIGIQPLEFSTVPESFCPVALSNVELVDDMEAEDEIVENEVSQIPTEYKEFIDVFAEPNIEILPEDRPYECEIPLSADATNLPFRAIYNLSPKENEALEIFINENLAKGFIRPSKSPIGAPIFFVSKKGGELRPCIDFRDLNEVTIKDRHPLPLINDLLDRVAGAKVFSKLDLKGAYNLMRMKKGEEWKTAFRCRLGHYEYTVMPFGLCNAPSLFQRMMSSIFKDMVDIFVIIYLDDILVFSRNLLEHRQHVRQVLRRLRDNKLFAKLSKCLFEVDRVEFLGFDISSTGISPVVDKLAVIRDWPVPTSAKEVLSFLGLINFYRRFIQDFAVISKPLTDLKKKDVDFDWSQACQSSFATLKDKLLTAPILHHVDWSKPFVLECDASDFAVGAVLSQPSQFENAEVFPVGYFSRKLRDAETRYHAYDKEMLAIVEALKFWRHYLVGSRFPVTIYSDHRNLEFFRSRQVLNARQARWSLLLNEYDFRLSYRPGRCNVVADALSRRPDFGAASEERRVAEILLPANRWNGLQNIAMDKLNILKSRHDSPAAGHFGIRKTLDLIKRDFKWKGMKMDVIEYVKACQICQQAKSSRHLPYGLLSPLPIPSRPWSSLSMDFITKLPESRGYDSILVVVCRFSKMCHCLPIKESITAEDLAKLFLKEIFRIHGLPDDIVTDRGSIFVSKFWNELLKTLRIRGNKSTAYHPQSDGQTERENQTLETILRCFVNYQQDDWVDYLHFAEFAINNAVNVSTGYSPFFINYGLNVRADYLKKMDTQCVAVEKMLKELGFIHKQTVKALEKSQEAAIRFSNRIRKSHEFKVGDKVWLVRKNIKTTRPCDKLDLKKVGPFEIIEKVHENAFRLKLPDHWKIHDVFNVSLLEKYHPPLVPTARPVLIEIDGHIEYEVETILDMRKRRNRTEYLVHWKGYGEADRTWEPIKNLGNARNLIKEFHEQRSKRRGAKLRGEKGVRIPAKMANHKRHVS